MTRSPARRRRLAPEQRADEILDAAAALVVEEGIAGITMAKIADRANVSKGLLYAYFANVKELLQAVLIREHRAHHAEQLETVQAPASFEAMARATAHNNHRRQTERGLLVARLRGDPEINAAMAERDRRTRHAVVSYLTRQVVEHYRLPEEIATTATELIVGPANHYESLSQTSIETMDEIWGAMMVGAMKELESRYGDTGDEPDDRTD